jgi:hypothetical protein
MDAMTKCDDANVLGKSHEAATESGDRTSCIAERVETVRDLGIG